MLGFIWVIVTQLAPSSDPGKVFDIAMQWRRGNFSSFAEGGYLFRYPFQSGIVLFYYFLSFFFGVGNYVAIQMVNVIALSCIYYTLSKLAGIFWPETKGISLTVFATFLLWPALFFYITYMYGTLPGLACSLAALYCAVKYIYTKKYHYAFLSSFLIGIATVLKTNCMIFLVAIICFLIYEVLDSIINHKIPLKRVLASLGFIFLLCFGVWASNRAVNRCVENLSGHEMPEGEVMVSWIVMGLSPDAAVGPGGYTGYIGHVFVKYNYDAEKITEASVAKIQTALQEMSEDWPNVGIPFFAKKTAFQWNDPTFISMDRMRGRISAFDLPSAVQSIIDGNLSVWMSVYLNYLQTLIWLGVLIYLVKNRKSKNIYELFGIVVFLGGFIFHMAWEASASYTVPYFVVIIPYAVKGYMDVVLSIENFFTRQQNIENALRSGIAGRGMKRRLCVGVLLVVLVAIASRTLLFKNTIALNDGDDAYQQFYHLHVMNEEQLEANEYYVEPYGDKTVVLTTGEDDQILVSKIENINGARKKVLLEKSDEGMKLRFRNTEKVLAAESTELEVPRLAAYRDDELNMFYENQPETKFVWKIERVADNVYYIFYNNYALTFRNGEVLLEEKSEDNEQWWTFSE